mmetsp:Transcript_19520/g.58994  ORF Transcript_19520/g.58994 Transcript_19520/m.58994 type:complete len:106 (+) Transcript_19520:559-876(+)
MAPPIGREDAEHRSPQNMASREKPSIRGAFVQPAADISIMRLSSSGMSRCSGDLDKLQSRMGRSGSNSSLTVEGSSTSYRGPFGHLGADPDADFASKTVEHGPHD